MTNHTEEVFPATDTDGVMQQVDFTMDALATFGMAMAAALTPPVRAEFERLRSLGWFANVGCNFDPNGLAVLGLSAVSPDGKTREAFSCLEAARPSMMN